MPRTAITLAVQRWTSNVSVCLPAQLKLGSDATPDVSGGTHMEKPHRESYCYLLAPEPGFPGVEQLRPRLQARSQEVTVAVLVLHHKDDDKAVATSSVYLQLR
jgi:hypothetical protein